MRQRAARLLADVYIMPELTKVGMLQRDRFDTSAQQGHAQALRVLDAEAAARP